MKEDIDYLRDWANTRAMLANQTENHSPGEVAIQMLYRKVGRRYKPVEPFTGFPADGVWLHTKIKAGHESSLVIKLADLNGIDARIAAEVVKLKPIIEDALLQSHHLCIVDCAKHIVLELTKYLQQQGVLSDSGTKLAQ